MKETMSHEGFTLKEQFPDITQLEIVHINALMKTYLKLSKQQMLPKRKIIGERYFSNQWPNELKLIAESLMETFRYRIQEKEPHSWPQKIVDGMRSEMVENPITKWGYGIPYYNGEWEKFNAKGEILNAL